MPIVKATASGDWMHRHGRYRTHRLARQHAKFSGTTSGTIAGMTGSFHALIPCAGSGSRSGSHIPKQYQPLAGHALLWHTLAAFSACASIDRILLVLAAQDSWFAQLPVPAHIDTQRIAHAPIGGASRAESVRNGLQHLLYSGAHPDDWVLVHDAARCLITPAQITQLIQACQHDAVGGLLALPLPDTLKTQQPAPTPHTAARVAATLPRSDKWLAQTPQMFRLGVLLHALEQGLQQAPEHITDEASAIERLGLHPLLVPGSAQNFKVTYPEDFALAQAVLLARQAQPQP